jgi:hypothetical protein
LILRYPREGNFHITFAACPRRQSMPLWHDSFWVNAPWMEMAGSYQPCALLWKTHEWKIRSDCSDGTIVLDCELERLIIDTLLA